MVEKTTTNRNSILLDPGDSCLLFIDFDETLPKIHPGAPTPNVSPAHQEVLNTAFDLFVPAFLTFMAGDELEPSHSPLKAHIPKKAQMPRLMVNPWKDERLREKLSEQGRHRLIMAGGWPEGSLVQAALGALSDGYDVYVLFDLSSELLDLQHSPVAARLLQAGVVPLTSRQLILEWIDAEGSTFIPSA